MTNNSHFEPHGFENLDEFLRLYPEYIDNAVFEAFLYASSAVEDDAKSTTSYKNVTGATRASTVAFAHSGDDLPQAAYDSIDVAESLNPGHADDESLPDVSAFTQYTVALTVMCATDYSYWLNIRDGGSSMFLEQAIADNVNLIMEQVVDYINLEVDTLAEITRANSPQLP